MEIALVGLSQKLAPVDVRERLAFPSLSESAFGCLRASATEAVLLSTCNRTEVYAVVSQADPDGRHLIAGLLGDLGGLEPEAWQPYSYYLRGREAVRHLYSVAAGLDSMIVGESQILGQVSTAYQAAAEHGATGPILNWVFPHAARVGKRVRAETGIGRAAVSVSTAAVELARRSLGCLRGRVVVVVGAGKVGELTTKALLHAGADRILIANRTYAHAAELAARLGGGVEVVADLLAQVVARADAVLSSTGATSPILTAEVVCEAMAARRDRPLLLVDLAVPRDVEPEAASVGGVTLYDIDDLQAVCDANSERRRQESAMAERIVAEELALFDRWWDGLRVVPTITALRDRAEAVRSAEVKRALRRLGPLSDDQLAVIDALTASIVNKLLHEPTARLKAADGSAAEYDAALRELFGLSVERRYEKAS